MSGTGIERKFFVVITLLLWLGTAGPLASQHQEGPSLRVLSPTKGYILGSLTDRRLSIVVEITCSESGVLTTDSGAVRFVEPNRNTRLFAEYIAARTEYVNHLGEKVIQVISVVPLDKLELADFSVNPPIAFRETRPKQGELKITVPPEAMVEAAVFNFQVQDFAGHRSSEEGGKLIIGLAQEVWRPNLPKNSP